MKLEQTNKLESKYELPFQFEFITEKCEEKLYDLNFRPKNELLMKWQFNKKNVFPLFGKLYGN